MIVKNIVKTPVYAATKDGKQYNLFTNAEGKCFWDCSEIIFDNVDAAINFMRASEGIEDIKCILPDTYKRKRS